MRYALVLAALLLPAIAHAETSACAQLQHGDAYQRGRAFETGDCGLKPDKKKAAALYHQAADKGDMLGEYALADTYYTGDGSPLSYPDAKKWYLKAAAQGYAPAQLRLGFLCAEKHFAGLTANYGDAEKWFRKAAEQKNVEAEFRLGNFYLNYKKPPDTAQGSQWLETAAKDGHRIAMYDLGRMLLDGQGVTKDTSAGLSWITQAGEHGLLQAQMTLVTLYEGGKVVPKDPAAALKWTRVIADDPDAAVFYLDKAGDMLATGDPAAARPYYTRAAAKGDAHAAAQLAAIYKEAPAPAQR